MVKSIITNLDMIVLNKTEDGLKLEIPTFKVDVTREVDVIEEVLRVYGYNHIRFDEQIRSSINHSEKPNRDRVQQLISEFMVANGFSEIMNNSLTKASYYTAKDSFDANKSIHILNPLSSELNVLRQSLIFGTLESIKRNINYKNFDIKFFEFGKHYKIQNHEETAVETKYHESMHLGVSITGKNKKEHWNEDMKNLDFFELKSDLYKILARFGIASTNIKVNETADKSFAYGLDYSFNKKLIASIGRISNNLLKELDITQEVSYLDLHFDNFLSILNKFETRYKEVPKFPAVRRDLALLVNQDVKYNQIEAVIRKVEKKLLKGINLFDVYEGKGVAEGKKSYAISMIFQDENRTLTDKIIDKSVKKMVYVLEKELGATLR